MSKIIKEGELPVKQVKCDYCGCEFEYDKRDLESECIGCYEIAIKRYSVECPYCHTSRPLPADILDQLKAGNPIKDLADDVKALAAQYGLEIEEIIIK